MSAIENSSSDAPRPSHWPPASKGQSLPGAGLFAMKLFIASLAVPFLVCAIGAWAIRSQAEQWLPEGTQGLPGVLWLSTAILLGVSWTAHRTLGAIRDDRLDHTRRYMWLTLGLAVAFLVFQFLAWSQMRSALAELGEDLGLYERLFYMLTGLHFCHVVFGMIGQGVMFVPIGRRHYWSLHHPGLECMALYWHFVDVAWLFFLAVLYLGW